MLAGASLNLDQLHQLGGIGLAFLLLRIGARQLGAWTGAAIGQTPATQRAWYGVALLPQAGVAVGMALIAAQDFPEMADTVLTLTIASTVVFEIVGPIGTYLALSRVARTGDRDRAAPKR